MKNFRLMNYITIGATVHRGPLTGNESNLKGSLGFIPGWFNLAGIPQPLR